MKFNRRFFAILGPGLLLAAVCIGVSHLVQSTRAGALFGMDLLLFVVLAFVMKYPTFRFGHEYAHATGQHLLEGFKREGNWALLLCGFIMLGVMFTGFAAIALITSGLAKISFGLDLSIGLIAAALVAFTGACLILGRYRWLDRMVKVLVLVLFVSTLVATAAALPLIDWRAADVLTPAVLNMPALLFLAALVGWMPAPFETCLWQSLWVLEKKKSQDLTIHEIRQDYHVGYFSTFALALCFMALGAAVMHGSGKEFAAGAAAFSSQLIDIYATTLGDWARPVVALAAFAAMLSTVIVVHDGFPRAFAALLACYRPQLGAETAQFRIYAGFVVAMGLGAIAILLFFIGSFKTLIDFATTLAFVAAPVFAWLIHRAMHAPAVPARAKPSAGLTRYSLACLWALSLFAVFYLGLRLFFHP